MEVISYVMIGEGGGGLEWKLKLEKIWFCLLEASMNFLIFDANLMRCVMEGEGGGIVVG